MTQPASSDNKGGANAPLRKPAWLRRPLATDKRFFTTTSLLNEQGYNRDWIERQLAHGERNSIRAAYNYAEYLPERRRMMQEWANHLDKLREV